MIKNNLKALLIHMVFSIVLYLLMFIEEFSFFTTFILGWGIVIAYVFLGYKLLKPLEKYNLLSVSSVAGLLVLFVFVFEKFVFPINYVYIICNPVSLPFALFSMAGDSDSSLFYYLFAPLPSLLFYVGIKQRQKNDSFINKFFEEYLKDEETKFKKPSRFTVLMVICFFSIGAIIYKTEVDKENLENPRINKGRFDIAEYAEEIARYPSEGEYDDKIRNTKDAIDFAQSLWCSAFDERDLGKNDASIIFGTIEYAYDKKSKSWLINGVLPQGVDGAVPYAIVDRNGKAIAVWIEGEVEYDDDDFE